MQYILNTLPKAARIVKTSIRGDSSVHKFTNAEGEEEHVKVNGLDDVVHVLFDNKGKKTAYAEVYLNKADKPVFVQTRVPHWVK